jgi:hypothetical protein
MAPPEPSFLLIPAYYLFFIELGVAPDLVFDISPLLLAFVAWLGAHYGKLAFYAYITSTLRLNIVNHGFGRANIGLSLDWYVVSLLVLWIYADSTSYLVRLQYVGSSIVSLLYRRSTLTCLVFGSALYGYYAWLSDQWSLKDVELFLFFAFGSRYAYMLNVYHVTRLLSGLLFAVLIGMFVTFLSAPVQDVLDPVSVIDFSMSVPGLQEVMSSLVALASGVLCREAFESYEAREEKQMTALAPVLMLFYAVILELYAYGDFGNAYLHSHTS